LKRICGLACGWLGRRADEVEAEIEYDLLGRAVRAEGVGAGGLPAWLTYCLRGQFPMHPGASPVELAAGA